MKKQDQVRKTEYLWKMRDQSKGIQITDELKNPPETLWKYVSNTNLINKKAGMNKVDYEFRENPNGGTFTSCKQWINGFPMEYEELPYEWKKNVWFGVERVFTKGVMRYYRITYNLEKNDSGGTNITIYYDYVDTPLVRLFSSLLIRFQLNKLVKVFKGFDENLTDAQKPALFDGFIHNQQDSEKEVELFHQWKHLLPENEEVPRKIAEFLASSPENLLQRIRPFELVEQYGLPKLDVLRFFLLASKEGFFQANWDLICPSCMGAKTTVSSLQEFKNEAHCDYCNINYTVNYSDNLELTFTPTEKARPVSKSVFCFGGPYNSSHVIAQVNVEPDQNRTLELNLEPGMYRVRSVTMDNEYKFEALSGRKPEKQHIELTAEFYNENGRSASTDLELSFHNTKEYTQTVKLERTKWRENVVTADYITSLQDFRDLFDAEVLKPGIRISISNLVIMFTDLKNSTYLYDTYGDSKAFSLVNDHFDAITQLVRENNGGVVKTIGDAVMAAFTVPRDAFRTALEIQEKFGTPVTDTPKFSDFVIKLGIHQGPCIILNLNDNLDYFGSSVNKAARVQGESKGDDIVISDTLYNNEDVKKLIREYRLESETFTKPLKGITETAELFRLTFPKEG